MGNQALQKTIRGVAYLADQDRKEGTQETEVERTSKVDSRLPTEMSYGYLLWIAFDPDNVLAMSQFPMGNERVRFFSKPFHVQPVGLKPVEIPLDALVAIGQNTAILGRGKPLI